MADGTAGVILLAMVLGALGGGIIATICWWVMGPRA